MRTKDGQQWLCAQFSEELLMGGWWIPGDAVSFHCAWPGDEGCHVAQQCLFDIFSN